MEELYRYGYGYLTLTGATRSRSGTASGIEKLFYKKKWHEPPSKNKKRGKKSKPEE
jgi:hypothetical protein